MYVNDLSVTKSSFLLVMDMKTMVQFPNQVTFLKNC